MDLALGMSLLSRPQRANGAWGRPAQRRSDGGVSGPGNSVVRKMPDRGSRTLLVCPLRVP